MDEATSRAIALFQEREGLKTSGKADQDTIKKLQERYGS
jgi:peptidoglycan hydrolase-like protein with peptidoglycan-binding domain